MILRKYKSEWDKKRNKELDINEKKKKKKPKFSSWNAVYVPHLQHQSQCSYQIYALLFVYVLHQNITGDEIKNCELRLQRKRQNSNKLNVYYFVFGLFLVLLLLFNFCLVKYKISITNLQWSSVTIFQISNASTNDLQFYHLNNNFFVSILSFNLLRWLIF